MNSRFLLSLIFTLSIDFLLAQNLDSLMAAQDQAAPAKKDAVKATFKTTRLVNLQTIEQVKTGELDFRISHRFDDIAGTSGGITTLYGFDNVSDIRIAFDYGLTDWWCIGFARSKGAHMRRQILDFNSKIKLLSQKEGKGSPIGISLYNAAEVATMKSSDDVNSTAYFTNNAWHRVNYVSQLLIARKFGPNLSIEIAPTLIHRNLVDYREKNTTFSIAGGVRYKFTKRMGVIVDYVYTFDKYLTKSNGFYAPLGIGLELETGGHVFHLLFSNNKALLESQFITANQSSWMKGQVRFGFNISRVFSVVNHED